MNFEVLAVVTGVVGVVVLPVSVVPQVVRAFRKGTSGISYPGSVVVTAVDISWFLYAVFAAIFFAAVADFTGSVLSATVLLLVTRNSGKPMLATLVAVAALVAVVTFAGSTNPLFAGFFAAGLSFAWRSFQFHSILTSPDISGVSISMWFLNSAGVGLWGFHGIFIGDAFLAVSCLSLGVYAAVIGCAAAWRRYRFRPTASDEQHGAHDPLTAT